MGVSIITKKEQDQELQEDSSEIIQNSEDEEKELNTRLFPPSLNLTNFSQVCPFCFRSFSQIHRHKCNVAPEGFIFEKSIVSEKKFFIALYQISAAIHQNRIDLYRINREVYRTWFSQAYFLLLNGKTTMGKIFSPIEAKNEQFFEEVQADSKSFLSKLRNPEYERFKNSKDRYWAKLKKICPYCQGMFIRLELHGCSEAPDDYNPRVYKGKDEFWQEVYKNVGAWDERGFFNLYYFNFTKYHRIILKAYDKLQRMGEPTVDNLDVGLLVTEDQMEFPDEYAVECQDEGEVDELEMMSREFDFDLGLSTTESSQSAKSGTLTVSQDGNPLCYTCRRMADCPRDINSAEMERVFECSFFEILPGMEVDNAASDISSLDGEKMPLCFSCPHMVDCPRGIDSDKMETIFACKYYDLSGQEVLNLGNQSDETLNSSEIENDLASFDFEEPAADAEKMAAHIIERKALESQSAQSQEKMAEDEKQKLLQEIMARWEEEKGELKVVCKNCEIPMVRIQTTKKVFYRCANYPECKTSADIWYINQATKENVVSHREHADLIVLYQYDKSKNIVNISEIYSEGKLFL